ncbi:MAG TPA: GNAT family N-acetyltransferase [Rhizomicrobium sp.]|nr:GNAT family N-acetyltransferase [Rhizomicrobium sp.]
MRPRVLVRPIASGDHAQWLKLWDGYNAFYGRAGATALPAEITATTWSRFFDPAEPMHALVADRDGAIVGIVHYLFHRSTIALAPTCYLQDLFTLAAARGGGIGRALIEAVCDKARAAGAGRVYWQTHGSNLAAMALYDKVAVKSGFLVYRREI